MTCQLNRVALAGLWYILCRKTDSLARESVLLLIIGNIVRANSVFASDAASHFSCFLLIGIRGEINVVVKVDLFNDLNRFRQSSCGVKFFCSK